MLLNVLIVSSSLAGLISVGCFSRQKVSKKSENIGIGFGILYIMLAIGMFTVWCLK